MGNKQKSVIFWAVVCALLTQNLVIPVMSRASFEEQKTYYSPDPSTGTPPSSGSHTPSHGSGGGHGTPSHGSGSHGGKPPAGNCGNPPTTPSGGHHHHHHNLPSGGHGGGGYSPSPPTHHGGTTPSTPTPSTPSTPTTPSTPIVTPTPDPGTPTTPGGGGYYPSPSTPTPSTPSTPSTPIIETPPTPTVDPGTPSTPGGGGYYPSPTPTTPSTPTIETPTTPTIDPGTPSTPGGGGSYPSPTPTTPIITPGTPSAPGVFPIDPNSPPFTCDYWRTHPALIWGLFGWWGTVGNSFGVASVPGFGSNMNLLQALSNSRTDAFGDLYREGTASLLNSMVSPRFTYTTNQVRDSFVSALSSDQSAEAQAQLFKLANEGRLKPRA